MSRLASSFSVEEQEGHFGNLRPLSVAATLIFIEVFDIFNISLHEFYILVYSSSVLVINVNLSKLLLKLTYLE